MVCSPWRLLFSWHLPGTSGWPELMDGKRLSGLDFRSSGMAGNEATLLVRLFELAPVTLPLGIYGAARAIRLALIDENNTPETTGGSLWVIWFAVAALAPHSGPTAPAAPWISSCSCHSICWPRRLWPTW